MFLAENKNADQKAFHSRRSRGEERVVRALAFCIFPLSFVAESAHFRMRTKKLHFLPLSLSLSLFSTPSAYTFTSRRNDICMLMRAWASSSLFILLCACVCRHLLLRRGVYLAASEVKWPVRGPRHRKFEKPLPASKKTTIRTIVKQHEREVFYEPDYILVMKKYI